MENPTYTFKHRGCEVKVWLYTQDDGRTLYIGEAKPHDSVIIFQAFSNEEFDIRLNRMMDADEAYQKQRVFTKNAEVYKNSRTGMRWNDMSLKVRVDSLVWKDKSMNFTFFLN